MLTSDKYLHLDKEDKQAAINSLPSFGLRSKPKKPPAKAAVEMPVAR